MTLPPKCGVSARNSGLNIGGQLYSRIVWELLGDENPQVLSRRFFPLLIATVPPQVASARVYRHLSLMQLEPGPIPEEAWAGSLAQPG